MEGDSFLSFEEVTLSSKIWLCTRFMSLVEKFMNLMMLEKVVEILVWVVILKSLDPCIFKFKI